MSRLAALEALKAIVTAEYEATRAEAAALMDAEGINSALARIGELPVASVSLVRPAAKVEVSDPSLLFDWVRERSPDSVEAYRPPPTERIKPQVLKDLLAGAEIAGEVALMPDTGEVIEGMRVTPAKKPHTMLKFATGGRDVIGDLYREGRIFDVVNRPQLGDTSE